MRAYHVVFCGPCQKLNPRTGKPYAAFEKTSRSGGFIRGIVETIDTPTVRVSFDNLIAAPVFGEDGAERNPTVRELREALIEHPIWERDGVDVLVGLSASVQTALEAVRAERRSQGSSEGPQMIFAAHPSFMMRRPKDERSAYGQDIVHRISQVVAELA